MLYLMQRLQAPRQHTKTEGPKIHHVFGGAALGLSGDAWKVLDAICTLDYMGAAEYEFGTIPRFLHSFALRREDIRPFVFVLKVGEYNGHWERRHILVERPLPKMQNHVIFGLHIGNDQHEAALEEAFRLVAQRSSAVYVKEGARMESALDPIKDHENTSRPLGWFCLEDDAMMFVDQTLFESFSELFSVDLAGFDIPVMDKMTDWALMKKSEIVAAAVAMGVVKTKSEANRIKKADLVAALED